MTEVIGVRFRGGCKEYYFDPHGIAVEAGQFVIVETAQGYSSDPARQGGMVRLPGGRVSFSTNRECNRGQQEGAVE